MSVSNCREPIPKKMAKLDGFTAPITAGSLVCKGYLTGLNVIIAEPEEIYFLHEKGNFGTCVPSRKSPAEFETIEQYKYKRRQNWRDDLKNDIFDPNKIPKVILTNVKCKEEKDATETEVVETIKIEDDNKVVEDPYPLAQILQLDSLESFYIMHSLECLSIYDENERQLDVNAFWRLCCEKNPNFIPSYVCYRHFRSKGWVAKNGLKFGVDLILYKDGPAYYHASYSVLIQSITSDLKSPDPLFSSKELNWTDILAWNRTTEHVSKELLMCYVVRTNNLTTDDLKSPDCLSFFKVQEVLSKRWKSCEEREQDDEKS